LGALGRQAERALLIQIGAVAAARDAVKRTAVTYGDVDRAARELNKYERRGARALDRGRRAIGRGRREVQRDVKSAQREFERQADGLRHDAENLLEQVKRLG
jgi:hypothetical protein